MSTAIKVGAGVVVGAIVTYVGVIVYFAKNWPG